MADGPAKGKVADWKASRKEPESWREQSREEGTGPDVEWIRWGLDGPERPRLTAEAETVGLHSGDESTYVQQLVAGCIQARAASGKRWSIASFGLTEENNITSDRGKKDVRKGMYVKVEKVKNVRRRQSWENARRNGMGKERTRA
jgi:hypothetical protein